MKVTAVSTDALTEIGGVPARVWHAETEGGVKFIMFVHRVAVDPTSDASEFERELKAQPAPRQVPLHQVSTCATYCERKGKPK